MLRVQETSRLASSTAEVILEKDMGVILPKDTGCKQKEAQQMRLFLECDFYD
jgi:hypothetical protein